MTIEEETELRAQLARYEREVHEAYAAGEIGKHAYDQRTQNANRFVVWMITGEHPRYAMGSRKAR